MKKYIKCARGYNPEYAFSPNPETRIRYAQNVTDPDAMLVYAYDPNKDVRLNLAYNPALTQECAEILANDEDWGVRYAVACIYHQLSDSMISTLMTDDQYEVREGLATNRTTPADVLRALSEDKSAMVRAAIAYNPNTPVDVLKTLAHTSWETGVVINLIDNPNTPTDVLRKFLSRDYHFESGYGGSCRRKIRKILKSRGTNA